MRIVKLGIIGLGRGFMLTLPALRAHPGIRITGAFDPRAEASGRFADEFDAIAYSSIDALFAAPDVDAVYIASPHETHAEQAIAALRAGKHVLVEKPMATSLADCAAMVDAADAAGRILIVGPSHGFDEPVRRAAGLVASGRFGAVRLVTALNFTDFMYRPRRPEELDSRRGGGVVYSQAAHQIDVVRRIVGQPVASVHASTGNWDPSRPSEGAYAALLNFHGGAAASLTYSGYAHYDSDELVGWISELGRVKDPSRYGDARRALAALDAGGEETAKLARTYGAPDITAEAAAPHHEHFGFILVSCERGDVKILPTGLEIYGDSARERLAIDPPTVSRASVIDELVEAIEGSRPAVHDARWGFDTMACCAAILQSSRSGQTISPASMIPREQESID